MPRSVQAALTSAMPFSPHGTERLIATGRVLLAAFSMLAVSLDPSEPVRLARTAHHLLVAYVVYAQLLALVVWRSPAPLISLRLVTHVFDLALFSVVMWLTGGTSSPFFIGLAFALLCAALRWKRRGTVCTGVAALAIFIAMGVFAPGGLF